MKKFPRYPRSPQTTEKRSRSGSMNRGVPQLLVSVVRDSGAGELRGLAGTLTIDIVEGKHLYGFEYSLAETP